MTDADSRTILSKGEGGGVRWEMATRQPRPRLAPFIRSMSGYAEAASWPVRRREFPAPLVVVIFDFGPPLRVFDVGSLATSERFDGGFVGGLTDGFTMTEHQSSQAGLQLILTPVGARRLLGMPLSELTNQAVSVRDLLPRTHRSFTERLVELPSWAARFDLVEDLFEARLARHELDLGGEVVAWAARHIEASGGAIAARSLADELGYSHKHMIRLFRQHIGVAPKLYARIVRFDRLMTRLRSGDQSRWSELALDLGYFDQSHLSRDVRRFSGLTPTRLRAIDEPFGENVNFVQELSAVL